jgi:hypothetical protein
MKKRLFISTVVTSLIMGNTSIFANEIVNSPTKSVSSAQNSQKVLRIQKSVNREIKVQKDNFKQASKEIMDGLDKTFLATRALENKKNDEAKKLLKESIKLFETALKAEPKLGLVPIAQEINVHVFGGDAKSLQSYLDTTVDMLNKHDTQEARMRLMPLEDDMIIATQLLPIEAYLESSKAALKLLDANKTEEAMESLVTGMNLMEVDMVVIPIPLMVAEDLIIDASSLDKSKKEEAQKLLAMAQDELEKAVLLGYTQKHTPAYKALSEGISEIQKEIKGKNVVEKLYDKLKNSFHKVLSKSREDVIKQKAQEKVRVYENKEAKKALGETSRFTTDAKSDESKTIK